MLKEHHRHALVQVYQLQGKQNASSCRLKLVYCSPEDGTFVLKHDGDAPLTLVLIKPVHLAGVMSGVLCYMIL